MCPTHNIKTNNYGTMASQHELHIKGQKNKNMLLKISDIEHIYDIGICDICTSEYPEKFKNSDLYNEGMEDAVLNEVHNYDSNHYKKICYQDFLKGFYY